MILYVIRHGQTDTNIKHLVNGRKESILTEKGKKQAQQIKKQLQNTKFNQVFSSPLSRAYQTAQIITDEPITILDDLIERSYGNFEGMRKKTFGYKQYWNYHKNLDNNNVESVHELFKRVEKLIKGLKQKYQDQTILIVTHSGIVRAIYYYLNKIPENGDLTTLQIPNCSVHKYII